MEIRNRSEIEFIDDACGKLQELYSSDNMSIAYAIITSTARPHMHKKMEEVYSIEKGIGICHIGDASFDVKPGDIIPLPKNEFHYLESIAGEEPLEVFVVTYPKYDTADVFYEHE